MHFQLKAIFQQRLKHQLHLVLRKSAAVAIGFGLDIESIVVNPAGSADHLVIAALHDSYTLFAPGELMMSGDIAALMTRTVGAAFRVGVQLSAPFLAFGLLFNLGLGVLSRLIPQMQVFFIGLPLSILLGLLLLLLVIGTMMGTFVGYLSSRESAATLGMPSSGAAQAGGWSRVPLVRMKLLARTPKGPFHAVIYNPRTGVEIDSWHGSSPSEAALRAFQAHHESTGEELAI